MKKIIIYGVKNVDLRRSIEYFLDDEYEIIGYSDGVYTYDILDGKNFIGPSELKNQEYDFILVAALSSSVQSEIRRNLLALDIPADKILNPTMFSQKNKAGWHADLIANIEENYHGETGLIFGLSYSACGILEKELERPFFNLSWAGMDFYYNNRFYQYMKKRGLLQSVNTALWVIPYYYFDYDMSRVYVHYENGTMFSVRRLDDWHHSEQAPGAWEHIENFRMFGRKFSEFYHMPKWKGDSFYTLKEPDNSVLLDSIWFSDHEKTVQENKEIFLSALQQMKDAGCTPIVVIPPVYLNALNPISRAALSKKKEKFYAILGELESAAGRITVFDYLDTYCGKRELFREITHLNTHGAAEFTKQINHDILGRETAGET